MFRQQNWTKNGFNSILFAKTKCIIIHLKSIIMSFLISRKSQKMDFFHFFLFRASCKILQDILQLSCELCGNLNSDCKKIPLSSPLTFAPLLPSPHTFLKPPSLNTPPLNTPPPHMTPPSLAPPPTEPPEPPPPPPHTQNPMNKPPPPPPPPD